MTEVNVNDFKAFITQAENGSNHVTYKIQWISVSDCGRFSVVDLSNITKSERANRLQQLAAQNALGALVEKADRKFLAIHEIHAKRVNTNNLTAQQQQVVGTNKPVHVITLDATAYLDIMARLITLDLKTAKNKEVEVPQASSGYAAKQTMYMQKAVFNFVRKVQQSFHTSAMKVLRNMSKNNSQQERLDEEEKQRINRKIGEEKAFELKTELNNFEKKKLAVKQDLMKSVTSAA